MDTLHFTLCPRTAFGGSIRGDTLFGQLCWAVRNRHGEQRLQALLEGYADDPFVVCSDAFPQGHLPRPALPPHRFEAVPDEDRKRLKKRQWLPIEAVEQPVTHWLKACRTEVEVLQHASIEASKLSSVHAQPHNSIHRMLGTTHGGEFAPYTQAQIWAAPGLRFDLWVVHDSARIDAEELQDCLSDIGQLGYGRDASIGLGKFDIESTVSEALPRTDNADCYLTLAPSAPQGRDWDVEHSHYHLFTRFGRHGDRAVLGGRPFKNPVLMADTGALLKPLNPPEAPVIGQGLGGDGELSKAIRGTVQQGYAPCVAVRLEDRA